MRTLTWLVIIGLLPIVFIAALPIICLWIGLKVVIAATRA